MNNRAKNVIKLAAVGVMAFIIIMLLLQTNWGFDVENDKTDTRDVGQSLFEDYGLGFIFISFILFSAMLGGIFLAKEKEKEIVIVAEYGEEFKDQLKAKEKGGGE